MTVGDSESEFLDDLFHGCVWAAFLDLAAEEGRWPDSDKTRRRAYRYYEEELAEKNRRKALAERAADVARSSGRAA